MRLRLLLACGLVLLTAVSASATSGDWIDVTCPVCGNTFEGWEFKSTNSFGGADRDFCRHARGNQAFLLTCWTCPKCTYTGTETDFDPEKLSKELVARLKAKNPLKPAEAIDPKAKRIDDIPAWVRWDLQIQMLDLQKDASVNSRAWVRLTTAHTQRFDVDWPDAVSKAVEGLWRTYLPRVPKEGKRRSDYKASVGIARALEADAANKELSLTPGERRARLLFAAFCFLSRGESPDAARVLATLEREHPKLPEAMRTFVADVKARIAREHKYLASALPLFERIAKEDENPQERIAISYLVGELHRKLGAPAKARSWLEPLLEKELPDGLKTWVTEAIEKSKAGD